MELERMKMEKERIVNELKMEGEKMKEKCKAEYAFDDCDKDEYEKLIFTCEKELGHTDDHCDTSADGWQFFFKKDQRQTCVMCNKPIDLIFSNKCFFCSRPVHIVCRGIVKCEYTSSFLGGRDWCTKCDLKKSKHYDSIINPSKYGAK